MVIEYKDKTRLANVSKVYINQVKSIVDPQALWVAVKCDGVIQEVEVNGKAGFAISTGEVFAIHSLNWNDTLASSVMDEELYLLPTPAFKTPKEVRIGVFEDVYKRGWLMRPFDSYVDFQNLPILLYKGITTQ